MAPEASEERPPGDPKAPPRAPGEGSREDRFLPSIPFFFGGMLALFLAYSLREEPERSGVPPLWVLFLTLGIIAIVAGGLLLVAREGGDDEEEAHEPGPGKVVVPREEWERVQKELKSLRQAQEPSSEVPSQGAGNA